MNWCRNSGAIIRGSCPTCGEIEQKLGDICVYHALTASEESHFWYSFTCKGCSQRVTKTANRLVYRSLRACGAPAINLGIVQYDFPDLRGRIGPDDVLELHNALEDGSLMARIMQL